MATSLPTGRCRLRVAADALGVSTRTIRTYIAEGTLTLATPPADRGPGRAWMVYRDEVHVLLERGKAACREYRVRMKRDAGRRRVS